MLLQSQHVYYDAPNVVARRRTMTEDILEGMVAKGLVLLRLAVLCLCKPK